MVELQKDGVLYGIFSSIYEGCTGPSRHKQKVILEKTTWFGSPDEPLQASKMLYHKGHHFKKHTHLYRERTANYTQEAFVVFHGAIKAHVFDDNQQRVGEVTLRSGDFLILYRGSHSFDVLKNDTIFFEIKNSGPFTTVEEDKKFLDD